MGERGRWSGTHRCRVCGKGMSSRGFAVAAHNRMHVRKGEMAELYTDADGYPDYMWVSPADVEKHTRSGHWRVVAARTTPEAPDDHP